jgi:hypothetical protein
MAEDTGRFAPYEDLHLDMVNKQLTYDALQSAATPLPGVDLVISKPFDAQDLC